MIAAKIGAIPDLLAAHKNTAYHAVGSVHQLVTVEYIAVLIPHTGFTVVAHELFRVQQQDIRSATNS